MFVYKCRYSILFKAIAIALLWAFPVNDITWADSFRLLNPSQNATLAPELRLKPFLDKHLSNFQDRTTLMYAIGELRNLVRAGEVREGHVARLNNELRKRLQGEAVEIDRTVENGSLTSGKRYTLAVFDFKKEDIKIGVLFLMDYTDSAGFTVEDREELKRFGIKNGADIGHLDCPGLEGVWFINPATPAEDEIEKELTEFEKEIEGRVPKADHIFGILTRFYKYQLNNLGEADEETYVRNNTKEEEREVLEFWAEHFKIPGRYCGYVTITSQQAELYAMLIARSRFPRNAIYYLSNQVDDILYHSLRVLGVNENRIRLIKSSPGGEIDYDDLEEKAKESAGNPAIVCLNAGRLLGAVDNLGKVKGILGRAGIKQKHIHYSMSPLCIGQSFLEGAPKIDFEHGADSMTLPVDRFAGSPIPGAIILTRREYRRNILRGQERAEYVNTLDTTIPGSRSGHAPLYLWFATKVLGREGFRARANRAAEVCRYLDGELKSRGYPCRLNERGDAIIFKQPSYEVRRKWGLLSHGNESCFEAIPYLSRIEIAEFMNDLLKDFSRSAPEPETISPEEINVGESVMYKPSEEVLARLDELEARMKNLTERFLGFPANIADNEDSYAALRNLFKYILRKEDAGRFGKKALDFFAGLYGVEDKDVFSGITAGGTWGNMIGLLAARERFPRGILYYSEDSHYSIVKVGRVLGMEARKIPSLPNGEIDYAKLEEAILAGRDCPVILNLNIGTTMKGAVDNPQKVIEILKRNKITDYYIHCDAALFGMTLPFLRGAPKIDLKNDVHSVAISAHKFPGLPMPSGIFMVRKEYAGKNLTVPAEKLLTAKTGYVLFYLWYAAMKKGREGFKNEANLCVENAKYLHRKLRDMGYQPELNEFSNIVVFARPSEELIDKWQLAPSGDRVHIVIMQHVTREKIDEFIDDLKKDTQNWQVSYQSGGEDLFAKTPKKPGSEPPGGQHNYMPDEGPDEHISKDQPLPPITGPQKRAPQKADVSPLKVVSAQTEAERIHTENLKYTPRASNKVLCHIAAPSTLPDSQQGMLNRLDSGMRGMKYSEKMLKLKTDASSDFIEQVKNTIQKARETYRDIYGKDYNPDNFKFDVACPNLELVKRVQDELHLPALAFTPQEGEGNAVQPENIMLALRALEQAIEENNIRPLIDAYIFVTGKEITSSVKDIAEFAKTMLFAMPKINVNELGRINALIEKNIKTAA
ncbi:MAG: histidine decarboxylase [Candidatus Omnitrophota bacterium]